MIGLALRGGQITVLKNMRFYGRLNKLVIAF